MKLKILAALLSVCLLLTGCSFLLEREYSTVEPHSSKFWESETAGTLRAENYQDVVNDLLLLITEHRESATLKVYNFDEELAVSEMLEKASMEVQQETPLGAYAVLYITSQTKVQRGFHEVQLQVGYRRTAEQIGRIGLVMDVTERSEIERIKQEFTANVSHAFTVCLKSEAYYGLR